MLKLLALTMVLASCAAKDDYPIGSCGGGICPDSGPRPDARPDAAPSASCITGATFTDPILIVDLDAAVGDCTVLALNPASPPAVIGSPKHGSTMQVALSLPAGSGSTPMLAVVVAANGMTCQSAVAVNQ